MARKREEGLTPRETQIMQVIWRHGEASVETIQDELPDRLVDSTIRTILQIMERKGYVQFRKEGRAKIYTASVDQRHVQRSAVRQMVDRLFGGSPQMLLARLVEEEALTAEDIEALRRLAGEKRDKT